MKAPAYAPSSSKSPSEGACDSCRRRAWLLAKLGARLEYRSRSLDPFWDLLALADAQLIDAVGGRRRAELRSAYDDFQADELPQATGPAQAQTICRHGKAYPSRMSESPLAPHMLSVIGGLSRLRSMLDGTVVAIVGTERATDYGMEAARSLARGLAASGITVASGLSSGIAIAAHSGALEAGGATFTIMAGGVDRCSPARCRSLYMRLSNEGCTLSELPLGTKPRRWSAVARARTLALLGDLVIVVEADDNPYELACAHLAQRLAVAVAAVPGRISSPASRGCHELIVGGAALVRDAQDVLDLLYGASHVPRREVDCDARHGKALQPHLKATLDRIGEGRDTLEQLTATGRPRHEILTALAELELLGLIVRGDGGRYVPFGAPTRRPEKD